MSTPTPPRRRSPQQSETKKGLSPVAKFAWGLVAAPFAVALVSLLVLSIAVLMAVTLTIPVWALWNWGLTEAAPLVGLSVPAIGLLQAWAVSLTLVLLRMVTTNASGRNTTATTNNKA